MAAGWLTATSKAWVAQRVATPGYYRSSLRDGCPRDISFVEAEGLAHSRRGIFSTKERRPWLSKEIRPRVWAYQSQVLQNLECFSVTVGGVEDHVHVLCNLTKKTAPTKVLEILKKDSSKFVKTLDPALALFHWQDGYGLFSISPSHQEAVREYVLNQEEHHKTETFQEEFLRILKKYRLHYDERYLWQ